MADQEQLAGQPVRIPAATYRRWLADLPDDLVAAVTEAWGEAPGELFVDRSHGIPTARSWRPPCRPATW